MFGFTKLHAYSCLPLTVRNIVVILLKMQLLRIPAVNKLLPRFNATIQNSCLAAQ